MYYPRSRTLGAHSSLRTCATCASSLLVLVFVLTTKVVMTMTITITMTMALVLVLVVLMLVLAMAPEAMSAVSGSIPAMMAMMSTQHGACKEKYFPLHYVGRLAVPMQNV